MPNIAETLADTWSALKKFAGDLAAQLPALGPRGNRGVKANLAILESWIRAARLKLAGEIDLPKRRKRAGGMLPLAEDAPGGAIKRRAVFRAIEPDAYEQAAAAENRFDISAFSGPPPTGSPRDQRPLYERKLAAIEAVLEAPEKYARRVKARLEVRKHRARLTRVKISPQSALPDLLSVSRHSDLGRYVWYNDSS